MTKLPLLSKGGCPTQLARSATHPARVLFRLLSQDWNAVTQLAAQLEAEPVVERLEAAVAAVVLYWVGAAEVLEQAVGVTKLPLLSKGEWPTQLARSATHPARVLLRLLSHALNLVTQSAAQASASPVEAGAVVLHEVEVVVLEQAVGVTKKPLLSKGL